MALTAREKNALDTIVRGLIDTLVERKTIRRDELLGMIVLPDVEVGNVSVIASLDRVFGSLKNDGYIFEYSRYSRTFTFAKGLVLDIDKHTFTKERNILHFDCYQGLDYDFVTKTFNIPLTNFLNADRFLSYESVLEALKYEWMFNYTNDIYTIVRIIRSLPEEYYKTMPAGFAKVIAESEDGLTSELLFNFILVTKYGKYKNFVTSLVRTDLTFSQLDSFLNVCSFDNLMKMIKNDIMNGIFCDRYEVRNSIETIINYIDSVNFTFDFNRGLSYNVENIKKLIDSEKNTILANKLKTLNFINGMRFGDFVVVVPQNQEEKQAEGRMQNNCVGYYYDDSIIRGENLIYFLRKANNIGHSYMTCRYNVSAKDTVEFRLVNNNRVTNPEERQLVEQISGIIRETLVKC